MPAASVKAISLWQPWASAWVQGLKRNETRSWATSYRGWLVVHAAKRWTREQRDLLETLPLADLLRMDDRDLPLGAIVGKVYLKGSWPTDRFFPNHIEGAWGDYSHGRYVWPASEHVEFTDPIPFRGRQRFFDVPDSLLELCP